MEGETMSSVPSSSTKAFFDDIEGQQTEKVFRKEKPTHVELCGILMKRNTAFILVEIVCLTFGIISFAMLSQIKWTAYSWRFYMGFGLFMIFCVVVAEVNRECKFDALTSWCHLWRYFLIGSFFILAVIDFIVLGLSDVPDDCEFGDPEKKENCPLLNPDNNGVRYVTRTLTILAGILFCLSALGYWERFSYFSAHSTWVQSILYMTIIGYIFMLIARQLEPPEVGDDEKEENWSWHQTHSTQKISNNIVKIMIFVVLFFVIMGTLVLALFADSAKSSGSFGTTAAILAFSVIAIIIMITPLAPGSVVDVCAGFLFVTLFVENENWDIAAAFFLALGLTIVLHFVGSCAQYYVGKMSFVQIWANNSLPPEMLAASDSVLKKANWFKVGIVGQVFMDTANGLNQGRMDMEFCTQFWSEYASTPSAISLVGLGTVLAIPSFSADAQEGYSWTSQALPLIVMIASLWQLMGSSWGAKELLGSAHKPSYWTALEKWTCVQYFHNEGYSITKKGWKNDILELGNTYENTKDYKPLFNKVSSLQAKKKISQKHDLHTTWQYVKHLFHTPEDPDKMRRRMKQSKRRDKEIKKIRRSHYKKIREKLELYIETEQIIKNEPKEKVSGYFDDSEGTKLYIQIIFVLIIFFSGVGSYYYVANDITLEQSVSEGIKVLNKVPWKGWTAFTVFWLFVFIYYHREIKSSAGEFVSVLHFVFIEHLKINPILETVYNTPLYIPDETINNNYSNDTKSNINMKAQKIDEESDIEDIQNINGKNKLNKLNNNKNNIEQIIQIEKVESQISN